MEIDPLHRKIGSQQYIDALKKKEEEKKAPTPPPAKETPPSGEDHVGISERAIFINRVRVALQQVPDVREDLVAELKRRIERDEYHVPGEQVAEKAILDALAEIRAMRG